VPKPGDPGARFVAVALVRVTGVVKTKALVTFAGGAEPLNRRMSARGDRSRADLEDVGDSQLDPPRPRRPARDPALPPAGRRMLLFLDDLRRNR
jgi:hypothetical protein